jgi:hypothetical protein
MSKPTPARTTKVVQAIPVEPNPVTEAEDEENF